MFITVGCEPNENPAVETDNNHIDEDKLELISEHEFPMIACDKGMTNGNEWRLVWNDEFHSQASLDDWNMQDWPSDKNGEWQYYSPENIRVHNDLLIIESRREQYKGREYTSGALTTEDIFDFRYGKVEIKAKIPKGQGVFPALWLVSSSKENWLPEIDIMENLGQFPNILHYVVHWANDAGEKMRDYTQFESEDIDFSDDFHIYGLLWEEDKIVWTLDGSIVFETEKFSPDVPLFLYMNTAIGGFWPGKPDPNDYYPKQMQVDYVRVFQKEIRR